ncbi:hypothetical protein AM588_10008067 [Phytophthora nicotianae]|uniref:Casein kinase II subunit beta n=1 Tax=Phytophthora nicotianae TaxID=4792 RepID=A0A0W8DBH0_PHYNI|nr:hypothetical protein AM588_10008067 [Phytophthora nicotianae]
MSDYEEEDEKWVQWFCSLSGNEPFCEVAQSYIEDSFNLYGLRAMVPNYQDALNIILDLTDIPYDDDVPAYAAELYGLIHARYIITAHGLDAMMKKYREGDFGMCPRALCDGQPVVPIHNKSENRRRLAILAKEDEDEEKTQQQDAIAKEKVLVFSKTHCPYCARVKGTLDVLDTKYQVVELDTCDDGAEIQSLLLDITGQRTVPNVFINGKHIGGCDDVMVLHAKSELVPMLEN